MGRRVLKRYHPPRTVWTVCGVPDQPCRAPARKSGGSVPPVKGEEKRRLKAREAALRRDKRAAGRIWDSFRFAFWLICPRAQRHGIPYHGSENDKATIRALDQIGKWIGKSVVRCGVGWTAKAVKEYAEYCRARALGSPKNQQVFPRNFPTRRWERGHIKVALTQPDEALRSTALAQMARLGRSMPEADDALGLENQRKHKATIESHHEVDAPMLDALSGWARTWASARRHAVKWKVPAKFSDSAADTVSKADGGQKAALIELAKPLFRQVNNDKEMYKSFLPADVLNAPYMQRWLDEWDGKCRLHDDIASTSTLNERADIAVIAHAALLEANRKAVKGEKVRNVATHIAELGWKARVVTKPSAEAVVVGNACRAALWGLLELEPRVDLSGQRDVTQSVDRLHDSIAIALTGARAPLFFSADLTTATDLTPHDVARAIWLGVMSGLGIELDHWLSYMGLWILNEFTVEYPDLAAADGVDRVAVENATRGNMMGLPLTWFVLNLINLAVADLATVRDPRDLQEVAECVNRAPAVVRGDDMVAAFTEEQAERYVTLMERVGLKVHLQKSYRSRTRFVLAERTFLVRRSHDPSSVPKRVGMYTQNRTVSELAPELSRFPNVDFERGIDGAPDLVSHPGVESMTMCRDIPIRHLIPKAQSDVPNYVAYPPAASAILEEFEDTEQYRAAAAGCLKVASDLVGRYHRAGIPLFLPREVGGAGMPHPRGFGYGLASHYQGHLRATLQLTTYGSAERRKSLLDVNPWLPPRENEERTRAEWQRINELIRAEQNSGLAARVYVPYEDAVVRRTAEGTLWSTLFDIRVGELQHYSNPYPKLGAIRVHLTRLFGVLSGKRFSERYLTSVKMTRSEFLEKRAEAVGRECMYIPYDEAAPYHISVMPRAHAQTLQRSDPRKKMLRGLSLDPSQIGVSSDSCHREAGGVEEELALGPFRPVLAGKTLSNFLNRGEGNRRGPGTRRKRRPDQH
nr:TPA_asm: RNA-dependent RNA polymerase [Ourmiavirus forcipomyiae]